MRARTHQREVTGGWHHGSCKPVRGRTGVGTTPCRRIAYQVCTHSRLSHCSSIVRFVTSSPRFSVAAALASLALLFILPAGLHAQHAHAGHGTGRITVPAGANYTVADVEFMQGMIAHHAQATHMSRMAEARGA